MKRIGHINGFLEAAIQIMAHFDRVWECDHFVLHFFLVARQAYLQ